MCGEDVDEQVVETALLQIDLEFLGARLFPGADVKVVGIRVSAAGTVDLELAGPSVPRGRRRISAIIHAAYERAEFH